MKRLFKKEVLGTLPPLFLYLSTKPLRNLSDIVLSETQNQPQQH